MSLPASASITIFGPCETHRYHCRPGFTKSVGIRHPAIALFLAAKLWTWMLGRSLESLITIGVEWSSSFTFSVRDDNLAHLCLTYLSAPCHSLWNIFSFALTPTFTITALPSSDTSLLASVHSYRKGNQRSSTSTAVNNVLRLLNSACHLMPQAHPKALPRSQPSFLPGNLTFNAAADIRN